MMAVFQLIVAPLLAAYPEAAHRIERSQALLDRYQTLSAQRGELVRRLETVEKAAARAVAYVNGSSHTLAGAALQNHVRKIIEDWDGKLHSSQVLPAEPLEGELPVRRVTVKLRLSVQVEKLQDLIYRLETAQPFVFIQELSILKTDNTRRRSDREAKPTTLEARLEIYGFMRAPHHRGIATVRN
jgi:general secretion pathway protein M